MTSTLKSAVADVLLIAFSNAGHTTNGVVVQDARSDSPFHLQSAHALRAGGSSLALANSVALSLAGHAMFDEVAVSGRGFLNLRLSSSALLTEWACDRPAERILVDFGGPNIAKPLHVGHLRSLVLGESIRRLLIEVGHDVVSDIHLGDWGLPMGQVMAYLESTKPEGTSWSDHIAAMDEQDFEGLYATASQAAKQSEDVAQAAGRFTAMLHDGDPGVVAAWKALKARSMPAIEAAVDSFDAHFDLMLGESDADADEIEAHCLAAAIARIDDGASVIDVARPEDGERPLPPAILRKSNGAVTYLATDLATAKDRFEEMSLDRVIYVVDQRQHDHFEQLRRSAARLGMAETALVHAGFGTVNGADGKPLRTRDGGAPRLLDLVADAVALVSARAPDLSDEDKHAIAMGGLKFADLFGPRIGGYAFLPEAAMAVEGDSGPYVQYACVRARSVLGKAVGERIAVPGKLSEAACDLHLEVALLADAVLSAVDDLEPCRVAQQALRMAKAFNRFYAEAPIIGAEDEGMRLHACARAAEAIERALRLLGISIPERM